MLLCDISTIIWSSICKREKTFNYDRLRGLCAYSDIDTVYTPKNYGKDGELMFVGYDHNQIIYDYATSQWEITKLSVDGNYTRAVTKASLASMAIGTNVWTVFNDSKR